MPIPTTLVTHIDLSPDEEYQHFVVFSNVVIHPPLQPDINIQRRHRIVIALCTYNYSTNNYPVQWDYTTGNAAKIHWGSSGAPWEIGVNYTTARQTMLIELIQDPFEPTGAWQGSFTTHTNTASGGGG